MGNYYLRNFIIGFGDIVETPYKSVNQIKFMDMERNLHTVPHDQVCLIVNVANENLISKDQISQLNSLQQKHVSLNIIAFPSNQFGNEKGDYAQIKDKYRNAAFKIMAKVEINGQYTSDLYKYLKRNSHLFNVMQQNSMPIRSDFNKVF